MHIKAKVVSGMLWVVAIAILGICVLVFAVNSSFDGVLNVLQQAQLVALMAVAMLLFVLVSSNILARQLSQPLSVLTQYVNSMSRGRATAEPPFLNDKDAIGDLARAIESLSDRLQSELSATVDIGQLAKRELMAANYKLQAVGENLEQSKAKVAESELLIGDLEIVDKSTGMNNRVHFDRVFDYEVRRSQRSGRELSLAAFELSSWRDVKAGLGRPVADAALKQIADVVISMVRTTDFVARYNEKTIVLLLPETEAKHAAKLVENIYTIIGTVEWQVHLKTFNMAVGAGLVASHAILAGEESLITRLESAVAKSLADGGGRVQLA